MSGQPQPIQAPPKPSDEAIAVATFLRNTNLKSRTCILQGQRKDLFKVKRAIRALESPEYAKASSKKGSKLPKVTNRAEAENAFRLLPMNLMALRVSKVEHTDEEGHEGHGHGKKKRVKGQWDVKIEQHQEVRDELYYCWFWEGPQWKQTVMAIGVLTVLLAIVMFPLWPPIMRLGVWYLSMGMLGLVGLFIAMSIFRLILFIITMVVVPPGLWLYPNLFEDVGFFDSFRPVWAWEKAKKPKGAKKSKSSNSAPAVEAASMTTAPVVAGSGAPKKAFVEEE